MQVLWLQVTWYQCWHPNLLQSIRYSTGGHSKMLMYMFITCNLNDGSVLSRQQITVICNLNYIYCKSSLWLHELPQFQFMESALNRVLFTTRLKTAHLHGQGHQCLSASAPYHHHCCPDCQRALRAPWETEMTWPFWISGSNAGMFSSTILFPDCCLTDGDPARKCKDSTLNKEACRACS